MAAEDALADILGLVLAKNDRADEREDVITSDFLASDGEVDSELVVVPPYPTVLVSKCTVACTTMSRCLLELVNSVEGAHLCQSVLTRTAWGGWCFRGWRRRISVGRICLLLLPGKGTAVEIVWRLGCLLMASRTTDSTQASPVAIAPLPVGKGGRQGVDNDDDRYRAGNCLR